MKLHDAIIKQFTKGYGLIITKPKKSDARFGRIYKGDAEPKDWRPFLPGSEVQLNSMFCVNFSYTSCLETITNYQKFLDGTEQYNFSDRWSVVKSETSPVEGNTLQNVCHAGLKEGNVLEEDCPWGEGWLDRSNTYWNEITDLSGIAPKQVFTGPNYSLVSLGEIKRALAISPLQVGVLVGETWQNEVITPPKQKFGGHAVELAYMDDKYYYIFDTAAPFIKKLTLDYPIVIAMSFAPLPENWELLNKQNIPTIQKKIIELAQKIINLLKLLIMTKEKWTPVEKFALAIQKHEGFFEGSRSKRNNNPGNLRYTKYTAELGAYAADQQKFCLFRSYYDGFTALQQFLKDAAGRKLKPYRIDKNGKELPELDLLRFFSIYAPSFENDVLAYAKDVANQLGVQPSTLIKTLV